MNKDEIQIEKATTKMKYIKRLMDLLQELNLLENECEMKHYDIILDYNKFAKNDFTTFIISIKYDILDHYGMPKKATLFNFNFKLHDEATGFAILKSLRHHFLDNNDLQYAAFKINDDKLSNINYSEHQIITNHHINLYSKIHDKKDEEKLVKFQNIIDTRYSAYKKIINTTNLTKDEIQLLKAKKKEEIAYLMIDMLHDLSNFKGKRHSYRLELEYNKKDIMTNYSKFDIKIFKDEASLPFNMSFKLCDTNKGIEILNNISKYFINTNNCDLDYYNNGFNSKVSYECVKYSENGLTKLTYNIPNEDFKNIIFDLSNVVSENKNKENSIYKKKALQK